MAQKGSFRRKAVGVGALGLVGLGIWLGQYFPGFGLGKGLGFGTGSESTGSANGTKSATSPPPEGKTTLTSVSTPAQTPVRSPERLRIIIDGDRYIIADSDSGLTGEAVDATEAAQRAKATTGDDQGVRVRIERTKKATAGAKQSLLEALDAANVSKEARVEADGFLAP